MNKIGELKDEMNTFDFDEDNGDNQDVFLSLGNKKNKNDLDLKLKKSKFGGYSKSSVQDYVEDMRTSLTQMKVNLEQQVYDLTAEKANVSEECKFLREKLRKAEQDYEKTQSEIKSLEEEYIQYCNSYKQREEELENSNNELKIENVELKNQIEKCTNAMNEINRYKQEIEEKQLEIERFNGCLDECKRLKFEECSELRKSIDLLQSKLQIAEGEVNMDEVVELRNKISELDSKNDKLMCELAKTKEEFERVKKENTDKIQENTQRIQENIFEQPKPKQNKNMEAELMELLEKLAATNDTKQKPTYENQRENNILRESHTERKIYEDKAYQQLEEKFNTLHNHFLNTQEGERRANNEKAALENMLKKYQQKERDFAFAIQQNSDYKNQITSLQKAISEILYQMEQQTEEMKSFAKAEEEKRAQMQEAIKERTNLQLKNVELMDKIGGLEKLLENTNNEKKELEVALKKEMQTPRIIKVPENSFKQNDKDKYIESYNNDYEPEYEVFKRADEFEQWINDKRNQLLV